jgi:HEAT repeat protein
MRPFRWLFSIAIVLARLTAAGSAEPTELHPTDQEFREHLKKLELTNPVEERLGALKWLESNCKAKNSRLAIPTLEECLRKDPEPSVRESAAYRLASIGCEQRVPCPLALLEALFDADRNVSESANSCVPAFDKFPPQAVEILLRCTRSTNDNIRGNCLQPLAIAGGKNKQVVEAIEKAQQDERFVVRHNAHVALFKVNDDLETYATYLIRLQAAPDNLLGKIDEDSEEGKQDLAVKAYGQVGAALLFAVWSEDRPDELAAVLLKLLSSPSVPMRKEAVRLIGACAWKNMGRDEKGLLKSAEARDPKKRPEPSKVASRFEKLKAADELRKIAEKDPDDEVRASAVRALARLTALPGR